MAGLIPGSQSMASFHIRDAAHSWASLKLKHWKYIQSIHQPVNGMTANIKKCENKSERLSLHEIQYRFLTLCLCHICPESTALVITKVMSHVSVWANPPVCTSSLIKMIFLMLEHNCCFIFIDNYSHSFAFCIWISAFECSAWLIPDLSLCSHSNPAVCTWQNIYRQVNEPCSLSSSIQNDRALSDQFSPITFM